jgi:CBS domain-containing protein
MKSEWAVVPSTAFAVRPDTPLAECIRAMRDRGVGSILVTEPRRGIVGIFTERDILKWVDQIQSGSHWDKPVGLLMTKPVHVITLDELDKAAKTMIEMNIRHLPVIHKESEGYTILGVISMRDLLRESVQAEKRLTGESKGLLSAALSKSGSIKALLGKVLNKKGHQSPIDLDTTGGLEHWLKAASGMDLFFLDLDGFPEAQWVPLLKGVLALKNSPRICIMYDPARHPESAVKAIETIAKAGNVQGYIKPINILSLSASIA